MVLLGGFRKGKCRRSLAHNLPFYAVILSSPTRVPRVAVEMTAGTSADSIGLMNAVMRSAAKDLRLLFVLSELAVIRQLRVFSRDN